MKYTIKDSEGNTLYTGDKGPWAISFGFKVAFVFAVLLFVASFIALGYELLKSVL